MALFAERSWLERSRRRHGDVFAANVGPFKPLVVVADPAEAKRIFAGDATVLHGGEAHEILEPVVGEHSVILLDENEYLHRRRMYLSPFHGDRMRVYGDTFREITQDAIDRWPLGTPFSLHKSMLAVTMRVIMRAVFGIEQAARYEELERRLARLLHAGQIPVMFPALQRDLGGRGPWGRFLRLKDSVDEVVYEEVRRCRADPEVGNRQDVLALLVQARDEDGRPLTDRQLRDDLVTLLVAGHETVASGLAWAFERLLRHPAVLARLKAELAEGQDGYLDAVIKETLRTRPPLTAAVRTVKAPIEVGGFTVPAGATLAASMTLIHGRSDLYSDAGAFRPERFEEGAPPPSAWLPFGGGVRRCVGAAFATHEMKAVIATTLERCDLAAVGDRPEGLGRRAITSVPSRGTRVVLRRRSPRPSITQSAARPA